MEKCWVCQEDIELNSETCWPVEGKVGVGGTHYAPNAPTHHDCILEIIKHHTNGPGGKEVTGYQKGAKNPGGTGLILRK